MNEMIDPKNSTYLEYYPDAIQDVDKAQYIASVSNEKRSEAAGARKFSRFVLKLIEDAPAHLVEIFEESSDDWIEERSDRYVYNSDIVDASNEFYWAIRDEVNVMAQEDIYRLGADSNGFIYTSGIASLRDYFERELNHADGNQMLADTQAERLEERASVLHDSPEFRYTPEQMIEFEDNSRRTRRAFKEATAELEDLILKARFKPQARPIDLVAPDEYGESRIEHLFDRWNVGPAYSTSTDSLVKRVYGPESDEYEKITAMLKNPATTLGEIQIVYEDALRKLLANAYKESLQDAEESEKIVETVRAAALTRDSA